MDQGKIDLNDLVNKPEHKLTIVPREDPLERDVRLQIELDEAAHRRRKDFALHVASFVVVGVVLALCVWAIMRQGATDEDRRWAVPLLTAIVTGFVGYVTGRTTK